MDRPKKGRGRGGEGRSGVYALVELKSDADKSDNTDNISPLTVLPVCETQAGHSTSTYTRCGEH